MDRLTQLRSFVTHQSILKIRPPDFSRPHKRSLNAHHLLHPLRNIPVPEGPVHHLL